MISNAFICTYPDLFFHLQGGCDVLLVIHGCDQLLERLAGKEVFIAGRTPIYTVSLDQKPEQPDHL